MTCFSREGEFGRGDLRDVLMYEFVIVALWEVCLYYAAVYLCEFAVICCCVAVFGCVSMLVV